jgi:hypothetical protein
MGGGEGNVESYILDLLLQLIVLLRGFLGFAAGLFGVELLDVVSDTLR